MEAIIDNNESIVETMSIMQYLVGSARSQSRTTSASRLLATLTRLVSGHAHGQRAQVALEVQGLQAAATGASRGCCLP